MPVPGKNQVLVKVGAASYNPLDGKVRMNKMPGFIVRSAGAVWPPKPGEAGTLGREWRIVSVLLAQMLCAHAPRLTHSRRPARAVRPWVRRGRWAARLRPPPPS